MKLWKRIASLLLAAVLTASISVPVLAAPAAEESASVSILTAADASVKLSETKLLLRLGKSKTLSLSGITDDDTVSWTVVNDSIATVSQTGKVTGKKIGTTTVVAKVNGEKYKCRVTVTGKVKLNKTKLSLRVGNCSRLKISGTTSQVTWYVVNESIATVNRKGNVTGKKSGTTTVVARVNGKKYKCKVTVSPKKSSSASSGSSTGGTVYWVPSGEVYHSTKDCPTLSRSKTIYSGSPPSGRRPCKVCH